MKTSTTLALAATLALCAPAFAERGTIRGAGATTTTAAQGAPARNGSGYYVPNVTDPVGNKVPIMQIPGSAVVVPRKVMDDQQNITVCDALRNVSGVSCR